MKAKRRIDKDSHEMATYLTVALIGKKISSRTGLERAKDAANPFYVEEFDNGTLKCEYFRRADINDTFWYGNVVDYSLNEVFSFEANTLNEVRMRCVRVIKNRYAPAPAEASPDSAEVSLEQAPASAEVSLEQAPASAEVSLEQAPAPAEVSLDSAEVSPDSAFFHRPSRQEGIMTNRAYEEGFKFGYAGKKPLCPVEYSDSFVDWYRGIEDGERRRSVDSAWRVTCVKNGTDIEVVRHGDFETIVNTLIDEGYNAVDHKSTGMKVFRGMKMSTGARLTSFVV